MRATYCGRPWAELNTLLATPDQMANFLVAKMTPSVMISESLVRLYGQIVGKSYHLRREPWRVEFNDDSLKLVGKQCLKADFLSSIMYLNRKPSYFVFNRHKLHL